MKVLLMGQAGVGKTRLMVKALNSLQGKTLFFSELPKANVYKIAPLNDTIVIKEHRPSVDILDVMQERYDNIVIDHWLRIKRISSRTERDKLLDIMEQSNANWFILAHTLKGKSSDNLDNGKYTAGLDAVIDLGIGLFKLEDELILRIIKDRYWAFPNLTYLSVNTFNGYLKGWKTPIE